MSNNEQEASLLREFNVGLAVGENYSHITTSGSYFG